MRSAISSIVPSEISISLITPNTGYRLFTRKK
nr:MAG TPA: hypothetical protein [Caudoviricetes sp.]